MFVDFETAKNSEPVSVKGFIVTLALCAAAVIAILVICAWLDRPIPTACVAELRDGVGNTVTVSGKVAKEDV